MSKVELAREAIGRRDFAKAETLLLQAVQAEPTEPGLHALLARLNFEQGRAERGVYYAQRAAELAPQDEGAQVMFVQMLAGARRHAEAAEHGLAALARTPRSIALRGTLVLVHLGMEDRVGAQRLLHEGLALDPDQPDLSTQLASLELQAGEPEAARARVERVRAVHPGHPGPISFMPFLLNYDPSATAEEIRAAHELFGRMSMAHVAHMAKRVPWLLQGPARTALDPAKRLRVLIVSGDLREHPVARFLSPWLRRHDRERLEVHVLSTAVQEEPFSDELRKHVASWTRHPNNQPVAVVAAARQYQADIALELAGLTSNNLLSAFAARLAPVQMTAIGYPNTTGLPTMNARLADAITDPPGEADARCVERLVRLDPCFLCYEPLPDAPAVAPLPAKATGSVTFGSFNALPKINTLLLRTWARVLGAVPGSRLLIKNGALSDASVRESVGRRAADAGIDPARLELVGYIPGAGGHLGAYGRVDIALDTFPYHGTTTTCEAMWMGVPVVSRQGTMHAGRVGASLLSAAGCSAWVAADDDGVVAIASGLAKDLSALEATRVGLRERMAASPLMDGAGYAARFDAMLRDLWRGFVTGPQTRA